MFENIKKYFNLETKAKETDKTGFSYRGASYGIGDVININLELYYTLYRGNTDLRRCIEELYQTTGKDGYNLFYENKGVYTKLPDDSSFEEILNYGDGFNTLKQRIIRDLQISGNVFILNILNVNGGLIGFQVLDPRTIRIVANEYGEVIKYFQKVRGNTAEYNSDEIFHFMDMNDHDNEVIGISKIETLCYDMLADKEAGRSNYSFFKNNTIPNTIIYLDNDLSEEEQKIALEQLKNQFGGGENRHKVSASAGIKDIKVISQSMKDMEFIALRHFKTERICSALGVPKTILGYSDNVNFSTSDNQYRKFIENTIKPLETQVEEILTKLLQQVDDKIELEFIDNHNFDITEKIDRNILLMNNGILTINEVREELGKELLKDDIANKAIIKQGFELLEDIGVNTVIPDNIPNKDKTNGK